MAENDFSLPRSSFGELLKMVHAYFVADQRARGEPVAVPDVASAAGMNPTFLSRNNKFFHSLGLIEGGQKKKLTPLGRELGLAVSHDDQALINRALAKAVDGSDFLHRITTAVRIRGGMDAPALQTHIAITAGAPKSAATTTGTTAVIQLLKDSGHLVDDGGTLRVGQAASIADDAEGEPEASVRSAESVGVPLVSTSRFRTYTNPTVLSDALRFYGGGVASGEPSVTVNLTLNITADNVEEARQLLRELLGREPAPQPDPRQETRSDDE